MSLPEKASAVEQVFEDLDKSIAAFQSWSALSCKLGCGKCCFKPDIEATILEFLPFALHLYQSGRAEQWYEKFQFQTSSLCMILDPRQLDAQGLCSEYKYRGLICRLFGYSARVNKHNQKQLVTCQVIKTEQKEAYENAAVKINEGEGVPVMGHYYMQLHAIDQDLTREYFPVNIAIRKAIETVLQYYAYRTEGEAI